MRGPLCCLTDDEVGIPHCLEQDDVYDGYFIPAGATIHALEWLVLEA
jgi:hypothetical protein